MHFGLRATASTWIDLLISNRCGKTHAPTIIYSLTERTPELTTPVRIPARSAHGANPPVLAAGAPSLRLGLPADRGAPRLPGFSCGDTARAPDLLPPERFPSAVRAATPRSNQSTKESADLPRLPREPGENPDPLR